MKRWQQDVVNALLVLALVLLVASILLWLGNANPLVVFPVMIAGVFGSVGAFAETMIRFVPLVIVALGLAPSLRINLFNIGAPGQIAIGALFATIIALNVPAPSIIVIPLCAVAASIGGALAALGPALLRARLKVNEILSTLGFNFMILSFMQYLLTGPMRGERANLPQSDPLPDATWLPLLASDTRAHIGILLIPVVLIVAVLFDSGRLGYRLKVMGASPSLAKQAGINARSMVIGTMCLAGAAAGIAGWIQVAGIDHRLYASVAGPIGYTGLFAALVGRLHPIGIILASFLFAALMRAGDSLQIGADVSPEIVNALVGFIMLAMAVRGVVARQGART